MAATVSAQISSQNAVIASRQSVRSVALSKNSHASFGISFPSLKYVSVSAQSVSVYTKQAYARSLVARASAELEHEVHHKTVDPVGSKLYVGNLPFNVDSESLAEIFQEVGVVELVEVIYDRDTGRSRGFAFVTMATAEEAEAAIQTFDGSELGGRQLRVNFPSNGPRTATPGPRQFRERTNSRGARGSSDNKLYVGNLAWGMDDVALEDLFSEYGKVHEARVVLDRETGRSRGFGFVTLSSEEEVNVAVSSLDGQEVDGRPIRVSLANQK